MTSGVGRDPARHGGRGPAPASARAAAAGGEQMGAGAVGPGRPNSTDVPGASRPLPRTRRWVEVKGAPTGGDEEVSWRGTPKRAGRARARRPGGPTPPGTANWGLAG